MYSIFYLSSRFTSFQSAFLCVNLFHRKHYCFSLHVVYIRCHWCFFLSFLLDFSFILSFPYTIISPHCSSALLKADPDSLHFVCLLNSNSCLFAVLVFLSFVLTNYPAKGCKVWKINVFPEKEENESPPVCIFLILCFVFAWFCPRSLAYSVLAKRMFHGYASPFLLPCSFFFAFITVLLKFRSSLAVIVSWTLKGSIESSFLDSETDEGWRCNTD